MKSMKTANQLRVMVRIHQIRSLPGLVLTMFVLLSVAGISIGQEQPLAASTKLDRPSGLALDDAGNLYISDTHNHRILKVNPSGVISTVAGTGKKGYAGDGGQATLAKLNTATGLAVDKQDNIYFSDTKNRCIRKVTAAGIISTVAGTGKKGYKGDSGQATSATLKEPFDVEVDSQGNLYIADSESIRRVTKDGIINTSCQRRSHTLAIDGEGNLYISQLRTVSKLTVSGAITIVAGTGTLGSGGDGGKATSAELSNVLGLAVDHQGNLYLSDQNNRRIRKVSPDGTITTIRRYALVYRNSGSCPRAAPRCVTANRMANWSSSRQGGESLFRGHKRVDCASHTGRLYTNQFIQNWI